MKDVNLRGRNNNIVIWGKIFPESIIDFATAWRALFCFVFKYGFWECPNFWFKGSIEMWAVIISLSTWICERTLSSTVFVFSALTGERLTAIIIWFWDRWTLFIQCSFLKVFLIEFSVKAPVDSILWSNDVFRK